MLCQTVMRLARRPHLYEESDPNGILTRVTAVKGRCPGPLDDRVVKARAISNCCSWTQGKLPVGFGVCERVRAFKAVPQSRDRRTPTHRPSLLRGKIGN